MLSYLVGIGQSMNTNKTVVVDSADKPNYIPNPQYDPIGYDNGRQVTSGRHKSVNPRAIALLVLLVVVPSLLVCFWLKSFIEYRYLFDPGFKRLIDGSITAIIITTTTAIAVTIVVGVLYVMGRVFKSGIVELPGGGPGHIIDMMTDWKRQGSRSLVMDILSRHFEVQNELARQSKYRNVTTYSPGMHYSHHYNGQALLPGDAARALPDNVGGVVGEDLVPTFQELVEEGIINNRPDEFVLGFEVLDD
jgi:hypothetical protein